MYSNYPVEGQNPPADQTNSNRAKKFVGVFFLLLFGFIGAIFLAVGIFVSSFPKNLEKKCTVEVRGIVVENVAEKSTHKSKGHSRTTTTYAPVFEYEYNGKTYTQKSNYSSSPAVFDVGDEAKLMINPDDPKQFYSPDDNTPKIIGIVFKIIGGVLLVVGVLVFILLIIPRKSKMTVTYYDTSQYNQ